MKTKSTPSRASRRSRGLGPWLLAALLAPLVAACFDTSAVDRDFKIGTYVTDWRDEVIYQILIDRFADGDLNNDMNIDPTGLGRYQGGDWQGVIDHLDYLEALGVTALWISPIIRNVDTDANVDGYHGYWAQDMTLLNPHMGDLAKLRELVNKAHARGFKVILDIVTNHLGQLFYYDINGNGTPDEVIYGSGTQSPLQRITEYDPDFDPQGVQAFTSLGFSGPAKTRWIYLPEIHRMPPVPIEFQNPDWYNKRGRVTSFDPSPPGCQFNNPPNCTCDEACARNQTLTGDFPGGLKDLKTIRPDVQRALTEVFFRWIQAADFDGFRIDTLKHVEYEFWEYFCPEIRRRAKEIGKNNFFMFGEAFDGRDDLVGSYTMGEQVDSAFFFPQKFAVIDRVIKYNQEGTTTIEQQFNRRRQFYGNLPKTNGVVGEDGTPLTTQQLMVNFIDNHDIPRFLYDKNSLPALHQSLAFIFFEDGIPCVYYGTEQQFRGGNDPANRERLWDTGFDTSNETFRWIRSISDTRKKFRPLRRGDLEVRWATSRTGDEIDAGVFAFERTSGDKRALVVMNTNERHDSATMAPDGATMRVGFLPGTTLVSVFGGTDIVQVNDTQNLVITLPPRTTRVYVEAGDADGIP